MADISKLEEQANLLMSNVSGWETSTLERIGKRIGKYGKMSLADVKSINNIAVVKQDMDAITKELAKVTGYNISQIEQMYGELIEEQHLANQPLYDYRGKTFVPFEENRELQAIARAYAKTTGGTMINLAKTKALCVLGTNGKPIGMQKYYTDVLDKAVMQVTTGATDFHTAMRDSIVELGGSGVRVDYGGGVTRRLDTVVRQNLLWGAKQASVEYNEMIGEELGCDGYEVDWHSNPRPSHEFMQGKQFVVGKSRTINGIHFDSFDEANERLQDYGCLHYKTPIICGISEPRYSSEELKRLNEENAKRYTIDGKEYSGYEITQMQRRLETAVRNEKTTRELARASGDNALVKRCNERIKAYQGKYEEISNITGIQGDKKRMSVPRGTASVKSVTPTKVEPPKPTFKKAETIEEAISQANDLGVKYAQFGKMPLEQAQNAVEAVRTLPKDCVPKAIANGADVQTLTGRPLGRKADQWWGATYDYRLFSLRTMQLGYPTTEIDGGLIVGLNTTKFKTMESLTKAKLATNEKYFAKTGRYWNFNTDGRATAFHEIGHCYVDVRGLPKDWEKFSAQWAEESMCDLLKKPDEAFAEAWAAFHLGDKRLPSYISNIIKGLS